MRPLYLCRRCKTQFHGLFSAEFVMLAPQSAPHVCEVGKVAHGIGDLIGLDEGSPEGEAVNTS